MTKPDIKASAHWYRKNLKWNVIPLYDNDKKPGVSQWKHLENGMSTEAEFESWFGTNTKEPTGLGVITGKVSGIVVVDEDSYKDDGMKFDQDSVVKASTPNGGTHYYFKYNDQVQTTGFRKGVNVEIRSDGGFLVLPPSVVLKKDKETLGQYTWISKRFDSLPNIDEWRLEKYKSEKVTTDLLDLVDAPFGTQHNNLRTMMNKILFKFDESEWERIVKPLVISEAAKFDPPHPVKRVEKMWKDCTTFVRSHKQQKGELGRPQSFSELVKERLLERELEKEAASTGYDDLDRLIKGWIPGHLYTVTGETNVGKCFGVNTPILMFDGTVKPVQSVVVGDLLMGIDGLPRRVINTHQGTDNLFQVTQKFGINYTINSQHILSLKWRRGGQHCPGYDLEKTVNVELSKYLSFSKTVKKFLGGWKVDWELLRKKINNSPQKNITTGYEIRPIHVSAVGVGKYFGIEVDQDKLFLLGDGTVVHNTTIACNFAYRVVAQLDKRVLYFALEPGSKMVEYMASIRLDKEFDHLTTKDLQYDFDGRLDVYSGNKDVKQADDLVKVVSKLPRYDLVIVDHVGYFINSSDNYLQQQSNVIKMLASLSKEKKCAIMIIAHPRKKSPTANKQRIIRMDDIAGSAAFMQDSTEVLIVHRKFKEKQEGQDLVVEYGNEGMIIVEKTKSGPNGIVDIFFAPRKALMVAKYNDPYQSNYASQYSDEEIKSIFG